MAAPKNRGLGRGLEALFGDVEINPSGAPSELSEKEDQKRSGAAEKKAADAVEEILGGIRRQWQ